MAKSKPAPKPKIPPPPDPLQSAMDLMVNNVPDDVVLETLKEQSSLTAKEAAKVMAQAKGKILSAADFDRRKELGQARIRLTNIYTTSLNEKNTATALAAQRDLGKLMGLYDAEKIDPSPATEGADDSGPELELVRGYLEPLNLSAGATSVPELARLAAAKIIALQSNTI